MKTVTSSIALAALVALGAFVLPCSSNKHPYEQLSEFLENNVLYAGLQDHVEKVNELILSMGTTFTNRDRIFRQLAMDFSFLFDERDQELCSLENLTRLRHLLETGLNYHNTCPQARIKGHRLDELVLIHRAKVRDRCYPLLLDLWNALKDHSAGVTTNTPLILERINHEVWLDQDLLKALIYRPGAMGQSPDSNEERIVTLIYRSFDLGADEDLRYHVQNSDQFLSYAQQGLINLCTSIVMSDIAFRTMVPFREMLAIELIDLPGDSNRSQYPRYFYRNERLPIYLVCEWIHFKSADEKIELLRNVYERLVQNRG